MADGTSSVPLDQTGAVADTGGTRSWEKPWDTDEMRKFAGDWSLAGDAGLLLHLQKFSQQLLARTHDMQTKLNEVNREAHLTGVRMNNVLSDFIMLANKQFVENRVYDEDFSITDNTQSSTQEKKEKTQEQREAELIPKINEALTMGLDVLDAAFVRVNTNKDTADVGGSTSTAKRSDLLQHPKDPYRDRRLPYLIGSISFMHEDSLGLPELMAEEEVVVEPVAVDRVREPGSTDGDTPVSLIPARPPKGADSIGPESETESEGDLFDTRSKDEDQDIFENNTSTDNEKDQISQSEEDQPANFLDELAHKFKGAPEKNDSQKEPQKLSKRHKDAPKQNSDDLFGQVRQQALEEGRDSIEEDDGFGQTTGRFNTKGGLFDNDEEEGGLFGTPVKKSEPVAKKAISNSESKRRSVSQEPAKKEKVVSKSMNLFEADDSEDDEDIFAVAAKASAKSASANKSRASRSAASGGGLFGEDSLSADEDGVGQKETIQRKPPKKDSPKRKVPAGGVSMFGAGGNPLLQSLKKQKEDTATDESGSDTEDDRRSSHHDTDTSSSADLMTVVTKAPAGGTRKKQGIQVLPAANDSVSGGLFDEPSDLFSSKNKAEKSASSSDTSRPSSAKTRPKQAEKVSIFDDEEDDLFAARIPSTSKPRKKEPSPPPKDDLFDEEEDDDLFGSSSNPKAVKKTVVSKPKQQQVLSLFDDDLEEEDDIFSISKVASSTKPAPNPVINRGKQEAQPKSKSGVFKDEDVLFGAEDDNLSVDLFGANSPLASPTKDEPSKPMYAVDQEEVSSKLPSEDVTVKKSIETKSLFSSRTDVKSAPTAGSSQTRSKSGFSLFDDDVDDIFASAPSLPNKPSVKPVSMDLSNTPTTVAQEVLPSTGTDSSMENRTGARPKVPKENAGVQKSSSLFDEEDLFSSSNTIPKQTLKQKLPKPPKSTPSSRHHVPIQPTLEVQTSPLLLGAPNETVQNPRTTDSDELPRSNNEAGATPKERDTEEVERSRPGRRNIPSSDEEDLFGSDEQDTSQKPRAQHKPGPPRGLPSGAVSMFGGMDPSSVLGKKIKSTQPFSDEDKDDRPASATGHDAGAGASTSGLIPDLGFDQPAQAPALQSATKSRAKLTRGRRPPTRKGRPTDGATASSPSSPSNAGETGAFFRDSPDFSLPNGLDSSTSARDSQDARVPIDSTLPKPASPRDTVGEKSDISVPVLSKSTDDLKQTNGHTVEKPHQKRINSENKPLDYALQSGAVTKPEAPNAGRAKPKTDIFDDDDDIFADSAGVETKQEIRHKRTSGDVITNGPSHGDTKNTEGDIFESGTPIAKKGQSGNDIFDIKNSPKDTNSDEDIFATIPSITRAKSKKTTPKVDDFDIFGSSATEEDIFTSKASSSGTKPKSSMKVPSQNKIPKSVDLFADDTDIFADLPPAKPRATKTKNDAKSQPSIFSDDFDEMFATSKPASSQKKSLPKGKSPKSKGSSNVVDDIFGDSSPSIFDDPLSATKLK